MDRRAAEDRKVGKQLFGRPTRLAVGLFFVDRDEAAFLTEIAETLKLPQSAVAQELTNFVNLELLLRTEIEGSRRVYYQRTTSPWWGVFAAARAASEAGAPDTVDSKGRAGG